jgi:Cu/Ag efflux protein CusF
MRIRPVPALLALGLLAAACLPAAAQTSAGDKTGATMNAATATAPGKAVAAGTIKTSATITAIDPATRGITLKRQDGKVVTTTLSEEVRNFDQLKVGDKVHVEYSQALALELKKGGGGTPAVSAGDTLKRSDPGQKPGGHAVRQVSVVADVVSVDAKKKLVTLKGPGGNVVDLAVEDPEQLKNIKKGDQVEALYSESLAVKVEAVPKK